MKRLQTYRALAPLYNLICRGEQILEDIRIMSFSWDLKHFLQNRFGDFLCKRDLPDIKSVALIDIEAENKGVALDISSKKFYMLELGLNLIGTGHVKIYETAIFNTSEAGDDQISGNIPPPLFHAPPVRLDTEKLEILTLLNERIFDSTLETARKRLISCSTKIDIADRFIDVWIGLESLYTLPEEQDELASLYKRRISKYLRELGVTKTKIATSYDYRSKIVRGVITKIPEEKYHFARGCLQGTIKRYLLEGPQSLKEVIDKC